MTLSVLVCLSSFLLTPLMIRYAKQRQLHDLPGERRSHSGTIPRAGGAVAILVLIVAVAVLESSYHWSLGLIPSLLFLAWIGWLDDHHSQPVKRRLLVQALCALWLVLSWGLYSWQLVPQLTGILAGLFSLVVCIVGLLTLIWLTNLYNFMDGSHGLAAAEAIFCGFGCYFILQNHAPQAAVFGLLLAAVMLGFLPWNFPRPKIFMGDVASGVLGISVGAMVLMSGEGYWYIPLVLSALFIVDTTLTLIDRVLRGQVWHQAHRDHLYQRLIRHGWKHHQVWLLYTLVNGLFILPVALWCVTGQWPLLLVLCALATILSVAWLLAVRSLRYLDTGLSE